MSEKKKNVPMIVALSIPVFMVLAITMSIYLPVIFVKPQYDFIYSTGENYCHKPRYAVKGDKIIKQDIDLSQAHGACRSYSEPTLFYYDVQRDAAREITFLEAQEFRLDNHSKSPDGFEIVSGNYTPDILFFGSYSSYYDKYLKKGGFSRRLTTLQKHYYHFKFVGWVKEGRYE